MWRFLCGQPAEYNIRVLPHKERQEYVLEPLLVGVDCVRRGEKVEYDRSTDQHIVCLRSRTEAKPLACHFYT
jgi:hypothetical protein